VSLSTYWLVMPLILGAASIPVSAWLGFTQPNLGKAEARA
jgi:hypothetical protein